MPLVNPTALGAQIAIGTYTGDGTVDRAIPHGLAGSPTAIFIIVPSASSYDLQQLQIMHGSAKVFVLGLAPLSVTAPDSTNFYVGNATDYDRSGNGSGRAAKWVAFL